MDKRLNESVRSDFNIVHNITGSLMAGWAATIDTRFIRFY